MKAKKDSQTPARIDCSPGPGLAASLSGTFMCGWCAIGGGCYNRLFGEKICDAVDNVERSDPGPGLGMASAPTAIEIVARREQPWSHAPVTPDNREPAPSTRQTLDVLGTRSVNRASSPFLGRTRRN